MTRETCSDCGTASDEGDDAEARGDRVDAPLNGDGERGDEQADGRERPSEHDAGAPRRGQQWWEHPPRDHRQSAERQELEGDDRVAPIRSEQERDRDVGADREEDQHRPRQQHDETCRREEPTLPSARVVLEAREDREGDVVDRRADELQRETLDAVREGVVGECGRSEGAADGDGVRVLPDEHQAVGAEQGDAEPEHRSKSYELEPEPREALHGEQEHEQEAIADEGLHDQRPIPRPGGGGGHPGDTAHDDRADVRHGQLAEHERPAGEHRRDDGKAPDDEAEREDPKDGR